MPYHIDADKINLNKLRTRIEATDLVPSRVALLEEIGTKFKALKNAGITTLTDLRYELKNPKRLKALTIKTGIDEQYLILLRREIGSYFPKPAGLKKFDWLPLEEIEKLEREGIANSASFYNATRNAEELAVLAQSSGVDSSILETLKCLTDLTRIQWVSPLAARMLVDAGYESASKVAKADPEKLCDDLDRLNKDGSYFKGKIYLRDIKRLVHAAGYTVQ